MLRHASVVCVCIYAVRTICAVRGELSPEFLTRCEAAGTGDGDKETKRAVLSFLRTVYSAAGGARSACPPPHTHTHARARACMPAKPCDFQRLCRRDHSGTNETGDNKYDDEFGDCITGGP